MIAIMAKLGIKTKLVFAFALILACTIVASLIALSAFHRFSEALSAISEKSVPFMADSMELTQLGMEISALAPRLANASTREAADEYYTVLMRNSGEIDTFMEKMSLLGMSDGSVSHAMEESEKVREAIRVLHAEIMPRIAVKDVVQETSLEVNSIQVDINNQLLEIIDNATFDFVVMTEDILLRNGDLIDVLLNANVKTLVDALYFETNAAELVGDLTRILRNKGTMPIVALEQDAIQHLDRLKGLLVELRRNESVITKPLGNCSLLPEHDSLLDNEIVLAECNRCAI